jgi:exonuclease VII large subunit
VVRNAQELAPGDQIRTRLAAGQIVSRVEEVLPEE